MKRSPDIFNFTSHFDCSEDDKLIILDYDSRKLELVDTTIPALTIVLSIVGLVINGIFIYLTVKGIREKKMLFKAYYLLLNRSITDFLTCLITLLFVSLRRLDIEPDPNVYPEDFENKTHIYVDYLIPHGRSVFTMLLTLDFWAAAGCYSMLAVIQYFAIRHPFIHRAKFTARRCIYAGIIVWLLGLTYSIIVVCISSNNVFNVFNNDNDQIEWTVGTSDYVLSISNLIIVCVSFVLVITSYVVILYSTWGTSSSEMKFVSLVRSSLNMFAFSISCVVMAGFVSIPLFLKDRINDLNKEILEDTPCDTVIDAYRLGYSMAVWSATAMSGWGLRMILDPVVNLMLDKKFKILWEELCCSPLSGERRYINQTRGDFLRKCVERNVVPISVITGYGRYFRFRAATFIQMEEEPKAKKSKNLRRFEDMY